MRELQKKQMLLLGALLKSKNRKDIPGFETIALGWNLDRKTRMKALDTIMSIGGEHAISALRRISYKSDDTIGIEAREILKKLDCREKKPPTGEMLPIIEGALI